MWLWLKCMPLDRYSFSIRRNSILVFFHALCNRKPKSIGANALLNIADHEPNVQMIIAIYFELWSDILNAALTNLICNGKYIWYFSAVKILLPNSFWAPRTSQMKFGSILLVFWQQIFREMQKTKMWFWAWRILKSIFLVETSFKQKLWTWIYWENLTRTSQRQN